MKQLRLINKRFYSSSKIKFKKNKEFVKYDYKDALNLETNLKEEEKQLR